MTSEQRTALFESLTDYAITAATHGTSPEDSERFIEGAFHAVKVLFGEQEENALRALWEN